MGGGSTFHLRALVGASVHFVLSVAVGAAVLLLVVADVMATPVESDPPWWLTLMHWSLEILNAPMAGFFGLWDNTRIFQLPLLGLAAGWSLLLGYAVSLAWRGVERTIQARHPHEHLPV